MSEPRRLRAGAAAAFGVTSLAVTAALLASGSAACGHSGPRPRPRIQVTLVNDSGVPICDVFMRPSEQHAAGWSNDWLNRDELVVPGARRSFAVPPGETWDVKLVECSGAVARTLVRQTWSSHVDVTASGR